MKWLDGLTDLIDMWFEQAPGVGEGQESDVLWPMGSQRVGHDWATEPTDTLKLSIYILFNIQTALLKVAVLQYLHESVL